VKILHKLAGALQSIPSSREEEIWRVVPPTWGTNPHESKRNKGDGSQIVSHAQCVTYDQQEKVTPRLATPPLLSLSLFFFFSLLHIKFFIFHVYHINHFLLPLKKKKIPSNMRGRSCQNACRIFSPGENGRKSV
jgi:hypothetical protein